MRIGKYEIIGLLGKGGMGRVYKAVLPMAGRIVALKLLWPDETLEAVMGAKEVEKRFLAEVQAMASFDHPNIAQILDCGRDDSNRPYYTMQYWCMNLGLLMGESFESELPTRVLPVDKAVRYGDQILSALQRMHHANFLHRDIKPFNVMIAADDTAHLIDFGLSALRGEIWHTPGGIKVGTPFYTAPEQEDDPDTADYKADLFSCGILLWRMLTGELPPGTPRKGPEDGPPPSAINPALGTHWNDFLQRAVQPEPAERFADAREMRNGLADAFRRWQRDLDNTCALSDQDEGALASPTCATSPGGAPRNTPIKVRSGKARDLLCVDELWRPRRPAGETFSIQADNTVLDTATGLVWQYDECDYPLDWQAAQEYVDHLNATGHAGQTGWRLPTADELTTILRPPTQRHDYCLADVFSRRGRWLWSADRCTYISSWCVDTRLGFVFAQDHTCGLHVRAVCDGC
ncbi:MAG: protein kinase domain-containing protein [Desulfovibrio sp.]|uniref:protein kinase domain-containing protein n=1 Tax=Desulfovibrio sp. 7SRBS1 TaxID=3378064 RepID=UPI003B402044